MHRTFPLFSILALLGTLLSGCAGFQGSESLAVRIPFVGDRAEYRGSDGSKLSVEFRGLDVRADPWMQSIPVALLAYTYKAPGEGWSAYAFEEAIDSSGRIVQQAALCANPELPANNAGPCHDDRVGVNFYAWGLPGAMGLGPSWSGHPFVLPSRLSNMGAPLQPVIDNQGECKVLHYDLPDIGYNIIPITLVDGFAIMCPSTPFPVEFRSSARWARWFTQADDVTYSLVRFAPAESEPIDWPEIVVTHRRSGVEFVSFEGPLYHNPSPDNFSFRTQEAIDAAVAANEKAARFLSDHPQAVPLTSVYSLVGTGNGGNLLGGRQETAERVVHVTDGQGPCLRLVVKRTVQVAGNLPIENDETTYKVEASSCGEAIVDIEAIVRVQATYLSAVKWASSIMGLFDPSLIFVGYVHREVATAWADQPTYYWYQSGYEINGAFKEPNPQTDGVFVKSYRYTFRVDGASGAMNDIQVPRERFPLLGSPVSEVAGR